MYGINSTSHNAPFCNRNVHTCALWDIFPIHYVLDTHDSLYEYIYNCVFGSLISDVTCNYVSADGGRDGLWWPALPGHWLSYTGC